MNERSGRRWSFGPEPDRSLAARAGMTYEDIDAGVARQLAAENPDFVCPEAGLPDLEAIERVFGLSPASLYEWSHGSVLDSHERMPAGKRTAAGKPAEAVRQAGKTQESLQVGLRHRYR